MNGRTFFPLVMSGMLSLGALWRVGGNHIALFFAPLVLVAFPMWFSCAERPYWARRIILLLALFYFAVPLGAMPIALSCRQNFQTGGLSLIGLFLGIPTDSLVPLFIDIVVYLVVCVCFGCLFFKASACNVSETPGIKLENSSLLYLLWCFGLPMLLGFDYQMQIIYWMSGIYYASSLVSGRPIGDLFFSCCCSLIFPFVCSTVCGEAKWESDAFLKLFGFLFENSTSRVPGIIVLTAYPTLFFLVKFWQAGKIKNTNEPLESSA